MSKDITIIEHDCERVLTTEQLAEAYGCTTRNISDNFKNNEARFEEGKHYFFLEGDALRTFKESLGNTKISDTLKFTSQLYLWTKRGAARHSKMLGTDRAWEMFDELSNQQAHDELLTVKDVAKVLHVGINAANSLVHSGVIPHINLNGAKVRRRALEAWMASMEGKDLSDPANPVPITKGDAA